MKAALAILAVVLSVPLAAQGASFYGTWIFVPEKSDLGAPEITFTRTGDEYEHADENGNGYKFRIDGKAYPNQFGHAATWEQVAANEWVVTYAQNGRTIGTERFSLGADGTTLTDTSTVMQGDREVKISAVMRRVGEGAGLVGTWRGDKIHLDPFELQIVRAGQDGITFRLVDLMEATGRFDGRPNPVTGPQAGKNGTMAFTRIDERSFKLVSNEEGLPAFEAIVAVAPDGRTLTETGQAGKIRRVWVFERK